MDRQTVRQRTESDARQRSGKSRRQQGRSTHRRRTDFLQADLSQQPQNGKPMARTAVSSAASPTARRRRQFRFASLLFVLGLWSVSLITAVWATRSLLDPTLSSTNFPVSSDLENPLAESEVPQPDAAQLPADAAPPAPIAEKTEPGPIAVPEAALNDSYFYQPPEAEHLPIVALGSIALSCAMSCILVSRALHPRRSPPRLEGRSVSKSVKRAAKPPVKQLPVAAAPATALSAAPAIAKEPAPAVEIIEVVAPAAVTVLPANQSLPLDWDEPSLADSLDLRRQQSLPF